jgi:hypothetical protein
MRPAVRRPWGVGVGVLAAFAAILAGCDRPPEDGAADAAATAQAKRQKPKDPLADMVSAVSGSRVSEPVELKFRLPHRPEVGKPIDVEIAVLPISPLDRIAANFTAGTGLELRSGHEMAAIANPEPNVPLPHRLTIVPERDGIFFVSAVVLADSEQSITRTFSIPIIAGEGLPKPKDDQPAPRNQPKPR